MTQLEMVKKHLEQDGKITTWQAFTEYGITRLSAHIHTLRHGAGLPIYSKTKTHKNRYGNITNYSEYFLEKS